LPEKTRLFFFFFPGSLTQVLFPLKKQLNQPHYLTGRKQKIEKVQKISTFSHNRLVIFTGEKNQPHSENTFS